MSKTVKTYPTTAHHDIEEALSSLGTGEAIVTVLSERGTPTSVACVRMRAPRSVMAAIGPDAVTAAARDRNVRAIRAGHRSGVGL